MGYHFIVDKGGYSLCPGDRIADHYATPQRVQQETQSSRPMGRALSLAVTPVTVPFSVASGAVRFVRSVLS